MGLNVKIRGKAVATFRYIHVDMMETLAQWTPSSPEMEAKLMLGEHIWDVAQSADALGKRTRELRMQLHHSEKPADAYVELLADIRKEPGTAQRLASFYEVLLPGLAERYRAYLDQTDTLMDGPTVRIIEQMHAVEARMMSQYRELRGEVPTLGKVDSTWVKALSQRESQIASIVT